MAQVKHNNHFVSQMYLKNWEDSANQIWTYRLLVPRANFRKWNRESIGGVAFQRDLYTVISDGQEDDSHERWIDSEFETPAKESLSKVIKERKLLPSDWSRLAHFMAAQDVRTPFSYIESTERLKEKLPEMMEKVLQNGIRRLEELRRDGKPLPPPSDAPEADLFNDIFDITITPNVVPEQNLGEIRAEIVAGRKLWIRNQRFLLTKTAKALLSHKWSIARPAPGMSWFTTDHPVLKLNYYKDGNYDLKGGWGKKGGNLLMPLSPNHLLYTQIGAESPDYFTFSVEDTHKIQKFLAERAYRWIFAHKQLPYVERIRPRVVDLEQYTYEEKKWKDWHQEQSSFEI